MFKSLLRQSSLALLLMMSALSGVVSAAEVELKSGHPLDYVVKEGDTLWGISQKFLDDAWLWPEIWQVNEQIDR
ncbi:MAG: LysM peptidoglycan-binding domain-containing protein, partial [Bermanella sp.]